MERLAGFLDDDGADRVRFRTAMLRDTVGIYGVGVVESARRGGIGAALTLRAARAFEDRTDLAWLQPSDMAHTMYADLGIVTAIDIAGVSANESTYAATAAHNASAIAWNAKPNRSVRVVTPVALNTAKSRERSIAWR